MASATKITKSGSQPNPSPPIYRLLTPGPAAEVLGIPEGTLAQWRCQRRGPPFIKLEGRLVRYRARDLVHRRALRHRRDSGLFVAISELMVFPEVNAIETIR